MSTVEEIEAAIQKLSPKELDVLLQWIGDYVDDAWDSQMKSDAKNGRFDKLLSQIDSDIQAGRVTNFPRK
jgi:hypothetical protein